MNTHLTGALARQRVAVSVETLSHRLVVDRHDLSVIDADHHYNRVGNTNKANTTKNNISTSPFLFKIFLRTFYIFRVIDAISFFLRFKICIHSIP